MSGGSYNYLSDKSAGELLACREDLERARDQLAWLGAKDVAKEVSAILKLIRKFEDPVHKKMAAIEDVLHELEWWESNDHSEHDFRAALEKYREDRG